MTYIVEPYLFWKGHYRQYFENLLGKDNTLYIYCNDKDMKYNSSIFVNFSAYNYESGFINFIMSRIVNAFKVIKLLNKLVENNDTVYFLEFEPFSALYFSLLNRNKKIKIIQTIHSVDRMKYSNKLKDAISKMQRLIFTKALHIINKFDTVFVVHYEFHAEALKKIISYDNNIQIIDYPSPEVKIKEIQSLSYGKSLLIFGLVREDKGIYEFLKKIKDFNLNITIAGKIIDYRVKEFEDYFRFIDKFLSQKEIDNLYKSHDFALVPYGSNYTGGAGPLKDALSYGKFVIVSNHKVFNKLVTDYKIGIVFDSVEDLYEKVSMIDETIYQEYSKNCLQYAKENTWLNMKKNYFKILKESI